MADESKPDWQVAVDLISERLAKEYPNHVFKIERLSMILGADYIYVTNLMGEPIDYDLIQDGIIGPCCYNASHTNGIRKSFVLGHYMGHYVEPIHGWRSRI